MNTEEQLELINRGLNAVLKNQAVLYCEIKEMQKQITVEKGNQSVR